LQGFVGYVATRVRYTTSRLVTAYLPGVLHAICDRIGVGRNVNIDTEHNGHLLKHINKVQILNDSRDTLSKRLGLNSKLIWKQFILFCLQEVIRGSKGF
jgi:hypothetical protein